VLPKLLCKARIPADRQVSGADLPLLRLTLQRRMIQRTVHGETNFTAAYTSADADRVWLAVCTVNPSSFTVEAASQALPPDLSMVHRSFSYENCTNGSVESQQDSNNSGRDRP
jgi:hypothetical protein